MVHNPIMFLSCRTKLLLLQHDNGGCRRGCLCTLVFLAVLWAITMTSQELSLKCAVKLTDPNGEVYSISCSPTDATLVASLGSDARGFLWKIGQGNKAYKLQGIFKDLTLESGTCDPLYSVDETRSQDFEDYQPKTDLFKDVAILATAESGTVAINLWSPQIRGPDRIVPIAERFYMDPGAVLDNYILLLGLAAKISEEPFTSDWAFCDCSVSG